jgi:hypothetical protein
MNTLLFVIITYCQATAGNSIIGSTIATCVAEVTECSNPGFGGVSESVLTRCLIKRGK